MAVIIPLNNGPPNILPFFDLQVQLDNVTYTLQFRWNVRAQGWYLDVLDEEAVTILVAGLRLVANWPLAAYNTGRRGPPGALALVDTSGGGRDPGLEDLGGRCSLLYMTAADLGLSAV